MDTYIVNGVSFTVNAGNVSLSESQYLRFKEHLKENKDGSYAVLKPMGFKQGESFGYDGDTNRLVQSQLSKDGSDEEVVIDEVKYDEPANDIEFPQHEGAGWYLLSDGNKIRGENQAKQAESELNVAS